MDTTKVGQIAAELMERIASAYDGDGYEIGAVVIAAKVQRVASDEPPAVELRCTSQSLSAVSELLEEAATAVEIFRAEP